MDSAKSLKDADQTHPVLAGSMLVLQKKNIWVEGLFHVRYIANKVDSNTLLGNRTHQEQTSSWPILERAVYLVYFNHKSILLVQALLTRRRHLADTINEK